MSAETDRKGARSDVREGEQPWLVRTVGNRISGPYSLDGVRAMIERGELQLGDEICHAGNYWFYLYEGDEVRSQLGIEIPQQLYAKKTEDATETQTDTANLRGADPSAQGAGATRMASSKAVPRIVPAAPTTSLSSPSEPEQPESEPSETDGLPELESFDDGEVENTAVMSNRAFRDFRNRKPPVPRTELLPTSAVHPSASVSPVVSAVPIQGEEKRGIERSRLFQWLLYAVLLGSVFLIIEVLRLLHQSPHGTG